MSELELLAALAENPDDDITLGVLADLFAEKGDPRGELIHLELGPSNATTTRRISQILDDNQERWLAPFAKLAPGVTFGLVRGLVGSVTGPPAKLRAAEDKIVRSAALVHRVHMWLDGTDLDLAPWRGSKLLARARVVTISASGRKPTTWQALGPLPLVRELVLDAVNLGPEEVDAIIDAVPNVEHLVLANCRLRKNALVPLARLAPTLRQFHAHGYHLGLWFGQMLGTFRDLRALGISGADLTDEGVKALLPALSRVEQLELAGSGMTNAILQDLLDALPVVHELAIGNNALDDSSCATIAKWIGANHLTRLHLGRCAITSKGTHVLAHAKSLSNLTSLVLSEIRLPEAAKAELIESPHLANCVIYAGDRRLARPKPTSPASPTGARAAHPSKRTTGPKRTARPKAD